MLAFKEAGTGPAVLLLHGFPLDHTIWENQVRHLAEDYRVITPDLPGMGGSHPLPSAELPNLTAMAEEVLGLMDGRKVGMAAAAGHSMGGYVALALQQLAPDRVTGLAMVGSQAAPDTPEARQSRFATARAVREQGARLVAESMLPKLFAPSLPPDSPLRARVERIIRRTSVDGIRGALLSMADRPDMTPYLPSITVPTLVLTGDEDRAIPPERSETMAAALPNATLVIVKGAGHMPMLEAPEEVNRALEEWLASVY